MSSEGELVFQKIVEKFYQRIQLRFITENEWRCIGRFFWEKMDDRFQEEWAKTEDGDAFESFTEYIRFFFVRDLQDQIFGDLFKYLSLQCCNYFKNFQENCIEHVVLKNFHL